MNPETPQPLFPEVYEDLFHLALVLLATSTSSLPFVEAEFLGFTLQAQITCNSLHLVVTEHVTTELNNYHIL